MGDEMLAAHLEDGAFADGAIGEALDRQFEQLREVEEVAEGGSAGRGLGDEQRLNLVGEVLADAADEFQRFGDEALQHQQRLWAGDGADAAIEAALEAERGIGLGDKAARLPCSRFSCPATRPASGVEPMIRWS